MKTASVRVSTAIEHQREKSPPPSVDQLPDSSFRMVTGD
jgi:hypothetical protein